MTCLSIRIRLAFLALLMLAAWAFPPNAQAHGTGSRLLDGSDPVRSLYFHYSSGEPMSWVKIKVYGPGDEKMEFQSARTDKLGRFAFLPDRNGPWRVEASDDEGHKAVAELFVEASPVAGGPAQAGTREAEPARLLPQAHAQDREQDPQWMRALLGVSLILNLFTGAALVRRNKAGR